MTSSAPVTAADVEARVLRLVQSAVDSDEPIDETTPLVDLPGFDSIVLVELVESLERDLGIEIAVEHLVPETFESVRVLTRTVWPAVAAQEEA
jgi:acyl carrier protein